MSQVDREHRRAERLRSPSRAGVEVLGLAARDHDRRAEAGELAGDRLAEAGAAAGDEHGVPSNVPGRQRASRRRAGGAGSPIGSVMSVASAPGVVRRAVLGARGAQLGHVVGLVDEGLVDHLVVHRRADLRLARGAG